MGRFVHAHCMHYTLPQHDTTLAVLTGVLERLAPVGGNTSVTAEADPSLLTPSTQAEARLSEQLQQRLRTQGLMRDPCTSMSPCNSLHSSTTE